MQALDCIFYIFVKKLYFFKITIAFLFAWVYNGKTFINREGINVKNKRRISPFIGA